MKVLYDSILRKRCFFLLLLFIIFVVNVSFGQAMQWLPKQIFLVSDMAADANGNMYVLWSLQSSETIDGHQFTRHYDNGLNADNSDVMLTSFTCNGTYRWTKQIGGMGSDVGVSVATDSMGGVYFSAMLDGTYRSFVGGHPETLGMVWDSIFVSNDTIIPPTYKRMAIFKYDTSGNLKWIRMPEFNRPPPGDSIADLNPPYSNSGFFGKLMMQPNGDFYFAAQLDPGSFADSAFIATYPLFPPFSNHWQNYYALKFDKNGNCLGGIHFDLYVEGAGLFGARISRDSKSGNYYLAGGIFNRGVDIDSLAIGNTYLYNGDSKSVGFLACFDSIGSAKWVNAVTDTFPLFTFFNGAPAVDVFGDIYATGYTYNGASFAGATFHTDTVTPYQIPFLMKFAPDGSLIYAKNPQWSAGNESAGEAITISNGVVGIAGQYFDIKWGDFRPPKTGHGINLFLARFNAMTGNIIGFDTMNTSIGSFNQIWNYTMASDRRGNFYIDGTFNGALHVGSSTFYSRGYNQYFGDGVMGKFGYSNCDCNPPAAHFSHNSLQQGAIVAFNYDGAQPVDSVIWNFGDGSSSTSINNLNIDHDFVQDGRYTVCAIAYNSCGSNMYCEELAIGDVGITEIPGFAEVSVYPNPATQMLTVSGASAGTGLGIYDALGRLIQQSILKGGKDQIDVSRLAPGIYLMRFTDKQGRRGNVKFVKE